MSNRKEFSAKVRSAAFERCGGRCENCGAEFRIGFGPEFDHIIPDGLGGAAEISNCRVLCRNCHKAKTHTQDRPRMAKADRIRKKTYGLKSQKPQSRFKRKINGETVERDISDGE